MGGGRKRITTSITAMNVGTQLKRGNIWNTAKKQIRVQTSAYTMS